jgi:hypothetical protein
MMLRLMFALFVAVVGLNAVPAVAQSTCHSRTPDEWLRQGTFKGPGVDVSADVIRPVHKNLSRAILLLRNRDAIVLTKADLKTFGLDRSFWWIQDRRLRPYLVRAVFPSPNPSPMLGADWDGDDLYVFAGGLGCLNYTKHPIVVFLDRKPRRVFVTAMSAL